MKRIKNITGYLFRCAFYGTLFGLFIHLIPYMDTSLKVKADIHFAIISFIAGMMFDQLIRLYQTLFGRKKQ